MKSVADIFGHDATPFKQMKMFQEVSRGCSYAPFADHNEWELAQWL